ncbi:helix-turn-helix transcriptional regulator [Asticcacaulis sp. MM231]|uniref:helix-turn-helix domain-containing protein n=1 Tax=Asticcacaulis sp. MM231 TaxID=3157666 RepID=UPI0032D58448
MAVGANIRQRRRKLKISQEALAAAIGLTFQQVQKYERGANRVSASMLYDISRILHCDAGDLLPRGDWKADGVVSDWLQDARALHRQHPDLFEALKAWPESHLRLLLATRQAPQKL